MTISRVIEIKSQCGSRLTIAESFRLNMIIEMKMMTAKDLLFLDKISRKYDVPDGIEEKNDRPKRNNRYGTPLYKSMGFDNAISKYREDMKYWMAITK